MDKLSEPVTAKWTSFQTYILSLLSLDWLKSTLAPFCYMWVWWWLWLDYSEPFNLLFLIGDFWMLSIILYWLEILYINYLLLTIVFLYWLILLLYTFLCSIHIEAVIHTYIDMSIFNYQMYYVVSWPFENCYFLGRIIDGIVLSILFVI